MAINKSAKQLQSDEVIKNILTVRPEVKKHKKEKKMKNLRIDADLIEDYELLCEYILRSSFTDEVIRFIQNEVYENAEKIAKVRDFVKM